MSHLSRDAPEARSIALFVAGERGHVGRKLCAQLDTQRYPIAARMGLRLDVAGTANTRALGFAGEAPRPRRPGDWDKVMARLHGHAALFVDCTASAAVAELYPRLLEQGIGVVTANKLALSGAAASYRLLHGLGREHKAPLRYDTTVGAALPILAPLRELEERGETPTRVEAVLSGTLSFLFARLNEGMPFSGAVREAYDQGYTEPHPARDLTGEDTARKLVIMLREAGLPAAFEAVAVAPLLPADALAEPDPIRFLDGLHRHDAAWRRRTLQGPLACLARYQGGRASVACVRVAPGSPFTKLEPRANLVHIHTRRYDPLPLAIAGPGAGPAITAAGVLGDIIHAARMLSRPAADEMVHE